MSIKTRVLEKEEARKQWEEQKAQREEERKKRIEDAERREEARRKREEERLKEEEERQRKWEESQLQRLDVHPYTYEIEMCEFLIRYCQKQDQLLNGRLYENRGASEFQSTAAALKAAREQERREQEEKRKKAIQEALEKGKIQRAQTVNEKAVPKQASAAPAKKPAEEEEEEEGLDLDIGLIQKFGRLNITAPIYKEDLPKSLKDLQELKLAFLQKGDEERQNAKAKFLK